MEKFYILLAICEENPPVTGGCPAQKVSNVELQFFLFTTWTSSWRKSWAASDFLRHHQAHIINHYSYITLWRHQMAVMVSQITSQLSVCSTVCSDCQQRNSKGPRYWTFVRGIHRGPVDSSHKGTVTWKMFPCDDVVMYFQCCQGCLYFIRLKLS